MLAAQRNRFLEDYLHIRLAEGRGSDDPAYYLALPQEPIRRRTYRYFEQCVLPQMEREAGRPLDMLDLGAGTGWMSYRLAQRGHRPVAVDILTDGRDGLGAARHFFPKLGGAFPCIDAEFDQLPFTSGRFDAALYNASLHYSSDYCRTLDEARRCLRPGGRIIILDSPVYGLREHGERMRAERHREFLARYGTASDHIASIEYLDLATIAALARRVGIEWTIHKPWYGLGWHLRPWKARLKGARPPSRFWILEGRLTPNPRTTERRGGVSDSHEGAAAPCALK
jgi:ubiquinone/menaquinone biosynthesis C-methylase UbiE